MWFTLPAHTPLYRASRPQDTWADVLQGYGAFFSEGGRYNRVDQQTIYTSPDVLAALTEFAWHEALHRSVSLGEGRDLTYPLTAYGKLWRFEFRSPISLMDLTAPDCAHALRFPGYAVFNPHPDRYELTRAIADQVRNWSRPPTPHTRPEGLLAPSVRTAETPSYSPRQVVLFVRPSPAVVPTTLEARATLLGDWDIELEFTTPDKRPMTAVSSRVAWSHPRFRLSGSTSSVPKYPPRSGSKATTANKWHTLGIQYSPS